MKKIINLTQHMATPEQIEAGVYEPKNKDSVIKNLTFEELPNHIGIMVRAVNLANIAKKEGAECAMIGGAPYLMSALEKALKMFEIKPVYGFTKRESVEIVEADGGVKNASVFKHAGFIEM